MPCLLPTTSDRDHSMPVGAAGGPLESFIQTTHFADEKTEA